MKSKYLAGMLLGAVIGFASCSDDNDFNVYDDAIVTSVVTGDAQTTATSATITGEVRDLSSQAAAAYTVGVVYSPDQASVLSGTRTSGSYADGTVTTVINGLETGRTYYYATFVTLQSRVSYYGEVKAFVTTDAAVATADAASVTSVSASLGGTLNGVADKLEAGSCEHGIALAATADLRDAVLLKSGSTSNSYTCTADKLVPNTAYYYAAYMVINDKPVYGDTKSFTTALSDANANVEDADFVNMGTKYEWAKYNVGASAATALGGLYGYGDVKGLCRSTSNADYAADAISGTEQDIALAAGMGFLPTVEDWEALWAITTKEYVTIDGVAGLELTSKANGNKLFFPLAGTRVGEDIANEGLLGAYWTAETSGLNADYAQMYLLDGEGVRADIAQRHTGLSVRPIRKSYVSAVGVDNSKLVWGDIESNGRLRIELYNEWGSTKANCPIDINMLNFEQGMYVTFKLQGVTGNLKDGAAGSYKAGLQYSDPDWWPSYWSDYTNNKFDCIVTGDGEYTVWYTPEAPCSGAVVFCIDIVGLSDDLVDPSKVQVEIVQLAIDPKDDPIFHYQLDNSKVLFVNKDGDGVNGRIELFNEYGDTKNLGVDCSDFAIGAGTLTVNFTISGIGGNLKSSPSGSYKADMSYAAASWWPSYWGGGCGFANITGNGTYNVQCHLEANCDGAVVWVIDIANLWSELIDPSRVTVTVNEITGLKQPL